MQNTPVVKNLFFYISLKLCRNKNLFCLFYFYVTRCKNLHVVFVTSAIRPRTKHVYSTKYQVSVEIDDELTVHNGRRRENGKSDFVWKFANEPRKTFVSFHIEKGRVYRSSALCGKRKMWQWLSKFCSTKGFWSNGTLCVYFFRKKRRCGKRKKSNKYKIRF